MCNLFSNRLRNRLTQDIIFYKSCQIFPRTCYLKDKTGLFFNDLKDKSGLTWKGKKDVI